MVELCKGLTEPVPTYAKWSNATVRSPRPVIVPEPMDIEHLPLSVWLDVLPEVTVKSYLVRFVTLHGAKASEEKINTA